MSTTSKVQGYELLQWAKDGGLLAITGIGIFLYVFLSIPAVIFYGRLGVSAGEVGITYAGVLSGSTLEVLGGLIILGIMIFALAFWAGLLTLYLRWAIPYKRYKERERRAGGWKPIAELSDEKFEERMAFFQSAFDRFPEVLGDTHSSGYMSAAELIEHDRRVRALKRLGVLNEQQTAELDELRERQAARRIARGTFSPFFFARAVTKNWMRRSGRFIVVSFLALVVVVLLPIIAYVQAGDILNGRQYAAGSTGIFDYHASLVRIASASTDPPRSIRALEGQTFFLLGENQQDVILYSWTTHSSIRVPSDAIIISSVQR